MKLDVWFLMKKCKESPHPGIFNILKMHRGLLSYTPTDVAEVKKTTEAASELAATQVSNLKRIAAERGKEGVAQGWLKFS